MRGLPWAWIASFVTSGTASRVAKRIGDAERADQPAAVIAISGFSEDVTMTVRDGLPATPLANVSIARAVSSAVAAVTSTAFRPASRGTSPTRTTCAPPASAEPVGLNAFSASRVASGMSPPSLSRTGARSGEPERTEAVSASLQSPPSASTTVPGPLPGYVARATAAADTAGSEESIRVVFFVAVAGIPRLAASDPLSADEVRSLESSLPPKHPANARTRISRGARRLTGGESRRRTTHPSPVHRRAGERAGGPNDTAGRRAGVYCARLTAESRTRRTGSGDPSCWGESWAQAREALPFCASPSANPVGRRKRVFRT